MHATASETSRQIVEFEELVSRLDRINNCSSEPDLGSTQLKTQNLPALLSLSSLSFSRRHHNQQHQQTNIFDLDNVPSRSSRSENFISDSQQQQQQQRQRQQEQQQQQQRRRQEEEKSVRVHIGIDDDLRMILEMDPSIVDRAPTPPLIASSSSSAAATTTTTFARAPRVTRPQGWYWIARD